MEETIITFAKLFSAAVVIQIVVTLVFIGGFCFCIAKGCNYITSGNAARDLRSVTIQPTGESNDTRRDDNQ